MCVCVRICMHPTVAGMITRSTCLSTQTTIAAAAAVAGTQLMEAVNVFKLLPRVVQYCLELLRVSLSSMSIAISP